MNSRGRIHFFLALASASIIGVSAQAKLRILTENWPPISYEEKGAAKGMAVELVQAIQKDLGNKSSIEVVPWARGYKLLQTSPNTMLFTLIRNPEREKMFTMLGPVARGNTTVFSLTKPQRHFKDFEVMKAKATVAVTRGTAFESAARKEEYKNILDVRDTEMALRLLLAGRVDLICDDSLAIRDALTRLKIDHHEINSVKELAEYNLYLGFSPGTDATEITAWKKSLETLKKNGQFASIYKKWLGEMKPPSRVEVLYPLDKLQRAAKESSSLHSARN